ncbi:MAG: DNA polymerase I [Tissierellia bacterium]|nr:DNA polymerase I [Tissierellia bacterium]
MKKRFVMIDGSSLIFRAFYAIRDLRTKDGIFTNGVYGFLSMYYKMMEEYKPDHVLVAFDRSTPTFRHEDYEDYKGNRQETPPELKDQFGILKDVLDKMKICQIDMDGYEADDIIGTMAKIAGEKDFDVLLFTGDRDYFQLVDSNIEVLLTRKGISNLELFDVKTIHKEYGVTPKELIEVKGLMGDTSDNIPGVPGVGEKTALKYIKKYGNIETLYEHIDEISGKVTKQRLIDNEKTAYLSRSLGRIKLDVPLPITIEDCVVEEPDVEGLRGIFERLEFNSFLQNLPGEESSEDEQFHYEFMESKEISSVIKDIQKNKEMIFHIFYDGDNYIHSEPKFLAINYKNGAGIFPFEEKLMESLKKVLEDESIEKISYDIKSDIYYGFKYGIDVKMPYEDLTVAEYLIDPSTTNYDISRGAQSYLERTVASEEEILGKGKKKKSYGDLKDDELGNYLGMNIAITKELRQKLNDIIHERKMDPLYYEIELPLVKVLASMEYEGITVDQEILKDLGEGFQEEIDELTEKIHRIVGEEFNINSPKQLGEILFEKLKLPIIKRTKTGYSTAQDVLEKLQGSHEIIDYIMRYRSLSKLVSTYIDGFIDLVGEDGKIHSTFNQIITATGRISSKDPNLQNIPIRTPEGRLIRKAFVAKENHQLVDADYSQIELRVLAHLSDDGKMKDAFLHDADIHRKTASEVFHVEMDEVTKTQRSNAKAVNFGIVYGVSDYGLSQNLGISRKEAKEYIEKYLNTYPGIQKYMDEIVKKAKNQGFVETIMHRRRYVPEIKSKNFNIRSFGERVALNTPIQGSAADIIKIAMVNIYDALEKSPLKAKLILQIHDELILETPEDEIDQVKDLLKKVMEDAVTLSVPMKVDVSVGKSWYDED